MVLWHRTLGRQQLSALGPRPAHRCICEALARYRRPAATSAKMPMASSKQCLPTRWRGSAETMETRLHDLTRMPLAASQRGGDCGRAPCPMHFSPFPALCRGHPREVAACCHSLEPTTKMRVQSVVEVVVVGVKGVQGGLRWVRGVKMLTRFPTRQATENARDLYIHLSYTAASLSHARQFCGSMHAGIVSP